MTIDEAILHAEKVATEQEFLMGRYDAASGYARSGNEAIRTESAKECEQCAAEHRQLVEWLKILKSAKFEYDEAWRIITHPTPDVTYADRDSAQIILDTFRDSLARANESLVINYESDKIRAKIHRQLAAYLRELQERRKADSCEGCVYEGCDCLLCVTCRRICKDKYKPERRIE